MFADRRVPLKEGPGVVLQIEATKEKIAAAVRDLTQHTVNVGEDEYIVDPRLIRRKISVAGWRLPRTRASSATISSAGYAGRRIGMKRISTR
jgi:hypothetical protein